MSQAQLLPTVPPSASLPSLTYRGLPVVTTEMLAKAYGCDTTSIKTNFNRNRERFVEGKHFFMLTNGDLRKFRDCVTDCNAQIPARTRNLTLWLERGAARHAKMLNTDQAWDVFEMLEETFFRVVKPAEQPTTLTPSTADDRKPLRSLVAAWAQVSGTPHQALWPQVKAHFQLARIDDLPVEWIGDALIFVQGKIDAAGKELPVTQQALPTAKQPPYRSYAEVKSSLGGIQGAMMDAFFPLKKSLENINYRTHQIFNNPQRRDQIATETDIALKHLIRALSNASSAIEESVLSCNETLSGLIELAAVLENPQQASKPVRFGVQVF